MNLVLTFVHPSRPHREVGPFRSVCLDADSVRDVASEEVIARHADHQWELEGARYSRMDAKTAVRIHFERGPACSRDFGPYGRFSAIDGVAYADERLFAFVDARGGDWFCYEDGHHWTLMVVSDATAKSKVEVWQMLVGLAPHLPGVIGLWSGSTLGYLGRAASIRSRLQCLAPDFDPGLFTTITWQCHPDPVKREAELLDEYTRGAPSLPRTYGALHGNRVRARRAELLRTA